jgi:hypothetical protein
VKHNPFSALKMMWVVVFCVGFAGCETTIEKVPIENVQLKQLDPRFKIASDQFVLCVQKSQKPKIGDCGKDLYERFSAISDDSFKIGALRIAQKYFGLLNRLIINQLTDAQYQESIFRICTDFMSDMMGLQEH